MKPPPTVSRSHLLTVSVEDYFHVGAFEGTVQRKHWKRFHPRLEGNITAILELLERFGIRATFFVLGCVADEHPGIVKLIVDGGHEVASSGFWPRGLEGMVPDEFRSDLLQAKQALEAAGSNPILGFRASRNWLREEDLWIFEVLAAEGYLYDSSVNPVLRRFASQPALHEVHENRLRASDLRLWEIPVSTVGLLGLRLPIAGGNYIRQLPHALLKRAVSHWDRNKESPLVFYFMPWELDPNQPHIQSLPLMSRIRHYRNLAKSRWVLEEHFERYSFQSIGDYLGVDYSTLAPPELAGERLEPALPREDQIRAEAVPAMVASSPERTSEIAPEKRAEKRAEKKAVTVVVPLFNEEDNVDYLKRTLLDLRRQLGGQYEIYFELVDDGSRDATWHELNEAFGDVDGCRLLKHSENRGIAAAIGSGLSAAETEIVCSIDCDCSYDPVDLEQMLPEIDHADLVTASPYHPAGSVVNVPGWRLFLSRSLSKLYNTILSEGVYTYTSCFRVYRKSAVEPLELLHSGFQGIAEMVLRVQLSGGRVTEFPTTLEARLLGSSKMSTLRSIGGHLGLLGRLVFRRSTLVSDEPVVPAGLEADGGAP